jgi:hypothetical protein
VLNHSENGCLPLIWKRVQELLGLALRLECLPKGQSTLACELASPDRLILLYKALNILFIVIIDLACLWDEEDFATCRSRQFGCVFVTG